MTGETSRRHILRQLAVGAAFCPICVSLLAGESANADSSNVHWSYEGTDGPEHWGELSSDFKACELGVEQAPINLQSAVRAQLGAVTSSFEKMPLTIVNNGYTIQINCPAGSKTRIDGEDFALIQFHFHHPSEHLLSDRRFELELHFVHKSAAGQLAVLGVFIKKGQENAGLQPIWAAMPAQKGPEQTSETVIAPANLLPAHRGFFR